MSQEHKEALAKGRRQGRVVRRYLEALGHKRGPGRPVDVESLRKKVDRLQAEIDQETNGAKRVEMIQERLEAEQRLEQMEEQPDIEELQGEFVEVAREYSERKGISYTAWREAGVPASVLKDAGIPRTRRTSAA